MVRGFVPLHVITTPQ